ncbi:MAG: aldehyde dehydrogenase family protein [Bacteroidales bacterium]|jgi:succinate-semialdehyde dehydrogenase/glutarate-semialdehyde dehydrogenase|nr:aldehyde dehydrogenase family protein [Bacteroidales bacterium]
MAYKSFDPYTGKINKEYEIISDEELEAAVFSSSRAFLKWKKLSIEKRQDLLLRLAELLEVEKDFHAATITSEMGKPISQALAEIEKSAMACRYYGERADEFLKPRKHTSSGGSSMLRFDPQGIVFAIMPWNFPYWQVIRCMAPALAAGNTVLLKHASNVPRCAENIENAVVKAGFPDNVFRNLFIDHKQAEKVIESEYVRSVSLTGSNVAGEKIASKAGANIKKQVLELGGNDAFIVCNDARLEKAAEAIIYGRFQNTGQSCIASKRLFVHEQVFPEFMSLLSGRIKALKTGNPLLHDTFIGPLVNKAAVMELERQVSQTVEMGAEIILGGKYGHPGDCYFEPTVLVNVSYDSPLAREEVFGPVLPVFTFKDYDELVCRVNDSRFGLACSVFTESNKTIEQLSEDIDTGTIVFNSFTRSDPALPFGGVKQSGYGRELSEYGIMEFVNIKTVTVF